MIRGTIQSERWGVEAKIAPQTTCECVLGVRIARDLALDGEPSEF
jgi:hypothetical protein